ncbi:MAG: 50S ribosomal protein L4 [Candidatus Falkowbacteria bacterium]
MAKVTLYNQQAENVGEVTVSDKIFNLKVNEGLVHQAMVTQLANQRQVLAHTKIRSEVRGGGKKPWKQKGTGRARSGSTRSPIWIGGGVTFGPLKERNFSKKINKKMKQQAIFMSLADKLTQKQLVVVDNLAVTEYKTKSVAGIMRGFESKVLELPAKTKRSWVVIVDQKEPFVMTSGRNLVGVEMITLDNINLVSLLSARSILITKDAVTKLETRLK